MGTLPRPPDSERGVPDRLWTTPERARLWTTRGPTREGRRAAGAGWGACQTEGVPREIADDAARVAVLKDLRILDEPRTAEFAALARLAAFICGTPTAAVNLIDSDRQWQAGAYGMEPGVASREDSMCAKSLPLADVTYTPDASKHEVFRDNPFVTGRLADVRLYISAPVVVSEHVVGSLCAFDSQPGRLSADQIGRLEDLAFAAGKFLELRRPQVTSRMQRSATRSPASSTGRSSRTRWAWPSPGAAGH